MICLDTPVLIWGVRGSANRGQEHMIDRTKRYIDILRQEKVRIMVPTPAVMEYLLGATDTEIVEKDIFEKGFFLAAFDAPAAAQAAVLQRRDLAKIIANELGVRTEYVRTDAMITAIAIVHKADKIITPDKHFRRLASGLIAVEDVPTIEEQRSLVFEEESGDEEEQEKPEG